MTAGYGYGVVQTDDAFPVYTMFVSFDSAIKESVKNPD